MISCYYYEAYATSDVMNSLTNHELSLCLSFYRTNCEEQQRHVSNISVFLLKFNVWEFYVSSLSKNVSLFLRENRESVAISGKLNPIKKNWSKFHMFTIK